MFRWKKKHQADHPHSSVLLPPSRVWPPCQPHTLCDGGEDPDRGLPLLPGVSDHHWLWFPLHHRGVSIRHRVAHRATGHHDGHGDLHHRHFPRKGTYVLLLSISVCRTSFFIIVVEVLVRVYVRLVHPLSGVPQGSVWGPLLSFLLTLEQISVFTPFSNVFCDFLLNFL